MRKSLITGLLVLFLIPVVEAVPTLQLYIDGATYDDATETWVSNGNSFDLYVIGKGDLNNVTLSMALENLGSSGDPSTAGVTIDGNSYPTGSWTYGYAPLSYVPTSWDGGSRDLPTHGIYPAWFTEMGLGNFTAQGGIGDVVADSAAAHGDPHWLPTQGYINSSTQGWFQSYHVEVTGPYAVHFDAFTVLETGEIDKFAPFSHDASSSGGEVPEPATMLLFGLGLAGAGVVRKLRRQ